MEVEQKSGVIVPMELKKEQERSSVPSKCLILNIYCWKMLLDNWKENVPALLTTAVCLAICSASNKSWLDL